VNLPKSIDAKSRSDSLSLFFSSHVDAVYIHIHVLFLYGACAGYVTSSFSLVTKSPCPSMGRESSKFCNIYIYVNLK
jgi:hypothetical protein